MPNSPVAQTVRRKLWGQGFVGSSSGNVSKFTLPFIIWLLLAFSFEELGKNRPAEHCTGDNNDIISGGKIVYFKRLRVLDGRYWKTNYQFDWKASLSYQASLALHKENGKRGAACWAPHRLRKKVLVLDFGQDFECCILCWSRSRLSTRGLYSKLYTIEWHPDNRTYNIFRASKSSNWSVV